MATKKKRDPSGPSICKVKGCERPSYARGYCQTHHRQFLTTGKTQPIRPYRPRTEGTVKLSGLRLSQGCADMLEQHVKERNISFGAVIAEILEHHLVKRKRPTPKKARR